MRCAALAYVAFGECTCICTYNVGRGPPPKGWVETLVSGGSLLSLDSSAALDHAGEGGVAGQAGHPEDDHLDGLAAEPYAQTSADGAPGSAPPSGWWVLLMSGP
jgi:hypothetical protein